EELTPMHSTPEGGGGTSAGKAGRAFASCPGVHDGPGGHPRGMKTRSADARVPKRGQAQLVVVRFTARSAVETAAGRAVNRTTTNLASPRSRVGSPLQASPGSGPPRLAESFPLPAESSDPRAVQRWSLPS